MYKKTVLNFYILFFTLFTISFKSSFAMISKVSKEVTAKIFCFLLNSEDLDKSYGQKYDYGKKLFNRLLELELVSNGFLKAVILYKKKYFFGKDKKIRKLSKQDKHLYNTYLRSEYLSKLYKIVDDGYRGKNFITSDGIKDLIALFICIKNKTFEKEIINIIKTFLKNELTHELCLSLAGEFGTLNIIKYFVNNKISRCSVEPLLSCLSESAEQGNIKCLKLSIKGLKKIFKKKSFKKRLSRLKDFLPIKECIGRGFVGAFLNNYENVTKILNKEFGKHLIIYGMSSELFKAAYFGQVNRVEKILENFNCFGLYSGNYIWRLEKQCKKNKSNLNIHTCLELIKVSFYKTHMI